MTDPLARLKENLQAQNDLLYDLEILLQEYVSAQEITIRDLEQQLDDAEA